MEVYELCPYCDTETKLAPMLRVQLCPECGKEILPCDYCYHQGKGEENVHNWDCNECPLDARKGKGDTMIIKSVEPVIDGVKCNKVEFYPKSTPYIDDLVNEQCCINCTKELKAPFVIVRCTKWARYYCAECAAKLIPVLNLRLKYLGAV